MNTILHSTLYSRVNRLLILEWLEMLLMISTMLLVEENTTEVDSARGNLIVNVAAV